MGNYIERFFEWQNYVHYLLLTAGLVVVLHFLGIHYFHLSVQNFVVLYAAIFVVDTVVHAIFWFLPEPLRWRD